MPFYCFHWACSKLLQELLDLWPNKKLLILKVQSGSLMGANNQCIPGLEIQITIYSIIIQLTNLC